MVYPPTDGHPSKYQLGPVSINFLIKPTPLTITLRHHPTHW